MPPREVCALLGGGYSLTAPGIVKAALQRLLLCPAPKNCHCGGCPSTRPVPRPQGAGFIPAHEHLNAKKIGGVSGGGVEPETPLGRTSQERGEDHE
jgi:hypothetical protein